MVPLTNQEEVVTADGVRLRRGRLFDGTSGRSFIAAVDHGLTTGPQPGAEQAPELLQKVLGFQPDGVLLSPGLLATAGELLAYRAAPAILVRADWLIIDERLRYLGEQHRLLCTPAEAAAMGADALAVFLVLGAADGATFADNVQAVATTARAAARVGLPVVVETVLWGARATDPRDPELLALGCRMAAELGASVVKTQYTGDPESMAEVVGGCPVPVLVLGGPRAGDEAALLDETRDALRAGASGVVYGRRLWQADDPAKLAAAVRAIIHQEGSG
ncbi:MAG TPA: fructose-bisphosphate aldolase [Actinomycetota bacterium]|nr:fructose-bisphosphate aldolase [Actinomycetota bacterium]